MKQTVVDWGNQRFWNVQTHSFNQEQIYDRPDVNPTHIKFTITISGLVREWATGATGSGVYVGEVTYDPGNPELPPTVDTVIPSTLVENNDALRVKMGAAQEFRYWVGCDTDGENGKLFLWAKPHDDVNTILFEEHGADDTKVWFDCNTGPKIRSINVTAMHAGCVARVTATFEICIPWCESYLGLEYKILEHTWSVSDAVDTNLYTQRTYTGRLKAANHMINPNILRALVMPPLVEGFYRQSMNFDVEEDGRTLAYRIVDKEATFSAPVPATKWDIAITESVSLGRPLLHTDMHIRLEGDRNTPKKNLAALATAIAEERILGLALRNDANNKTVMIESLSLAEYISQDRPISIDMRLQVVGLRNDGKDNDDNNVLFGKAGAFGKTLRGANWPYQPPIDEETGIGGYDSNKSTDPGTAGVISLVTALRNSFKTTCTEQPAVRDGTYSDPDTILDPITEPDDSLVPELTVRSVANGSTTRPEFISVHYGDAIYTKYQVDSLYDTNYNRSQLAIAGMASSYTTGSPTCSIVGLGYPMTTRKIRIEATRHGLAPRLQEPKDTWTTGTMTFTRLETLIAPTSPELTHVGQELWTIRAEYLYACSRNPLNNEALPIGLDPTWTGQAYSLPAGALDTYDESSNMS